MEIISDIKCVYIALNGFLFYKYPSIKGSEKDYLVKDLTGFVMQTLKCTLT
jgi:hypothetical protein